jgi:hypothetical protein
MGWGILYTKMGSHDPFGHLKHKLWPKERSGIKLPTWLLDSWPLKVGNHSDFFVWRWCATYCWKALNEGYNFALDLISIKGLHAKLWAPKVARVPIVGISRFPFGSSRTKWHLGVGPMTSHIIYYKGEGGGFPQVRAMMSFVSSSLPLPCPSNKSASTMH